MPRRHLGSGTCVIGLIAASAVAGCSSDNGAAASAGDSGPPDQFVADSGNSDDASRGDAGRTAEGGPADAGRNDANAITDDGGSTALIDDQSASTGTQIALSVGLPSGALAGTWYNYDDGTGTMVPALHSFAFTPLGVTVDDAGTTLAKGACESGSGYVGYGAGWGMTVAMQPNDAGPDAGPSTHVPYDASRWAGISFWAAIVGDAGVNAQTVRVGLPDIDTYSDYPGSTCNHADPDASTCVGTCGCDNNWGRFVTLTPGWIQYRLDFDPMASYGVAQDPNWGYQVAAFDPSKIFALQFQIDGPNKPDGGARPASFPEICVAQVQFYR